MERVDPTPRFELAAREKRISSRPYREFGKLGAFSPALFNGDPSTTPPPHKSVSQWLSLTEQNTGTKPGIGKIEIQRNPVN